MIDKDIFQKYLDEYKEDFVQRFKFATGFIWKAVKTFQDNFTLETEKFSEMLEKSLSDTYILMAFRSRMSQIEPKRQILWFAEISPEETKHIFNDLFDEKISLINRLSAVKEKISAMYRKYNPDKTHFIKNYQTLYILYLYLFLRYPEKYFIYQELMFKKARDFLSASYKYEENKPYKNLVNCHLFMKELQKNLKQDKELVTTLSSCLEDIHYSDENLNILTSDFTYFLKVRSSSENRLSYKPKFLKKNVKKNKPYYRDKDNVDKNTDNNTDNDDSAKNEKENLE